MKIKPKTHSGMLPQFRLLRAPCNDPGKAKPGMHSAELSIAQTGFQHARGERSQEPSPAQAEKRGVTRVFVLAKDGTPLMPCHAARARELLGKGKAIVVRRCPFVIRLKYDLTQPKTQPVTIKLDPGARTTGIAIVRLTENAHHVLHLSELTHRGSYIKERMEQRRSFRRNRRNRKTRYRAPRFDHRTRLKGWLPPSLQSRVDNVSSWVSRYRRWCPISEIIVETVRFDTQKIINPEISGTEYQQGTLAGYELREYLLEKFQRSCAYCARVNVPLEIDHVQPRSKGGSDRVSNLTIACQDCNRIKGNQTIELFLAKDPERLERIKSQLQTSLSATAAVNATRTKVLGAMFVTGLAVEVSSGGKTKFNRTRLNVPKTHALDAACTGNMPRLRGWQMPILGIKACGRGSYQRTRLDEYGFPRGYLSRQKKAKGFQTGDIVRASISKGKKAGVHTGRVAIRTSGSFNVQTLAATIQGISHKHCLLLQHADGYGYQLRQPSTHD